MVFKLSDSRRVTIPKDICQKLNFKSGDELSLYIQDNSVVISPIATRVETMEVTKVEEVKTDAPIKSTEKSAKSKKTTIKIVSNLEEGSKLSRQIKSQCGLVIRTKTKYINAFCEQCQGQLAREYGVKDHPCKYIESCNSIEPAEEIKSEIEVKSKPVKKRKQVIKDIEQNIDKLNKKLDKQITELSEPKKDLIKELKSKTRKKHIGTAESVIQPVSYKSAALCEGCNSFHTKGFLIDDEFRCKKCTIEDFKYFMNNRDKEDK